MKKFSFLMFFATLAFVMQAQDIKLPDPVEGGDMPLKEALKVRETVRDFLTEDVSLEQISSLLWAANGINRPESGKRTAPSARNIQETDIYLFSQKGIFLYVPEKHILSLIREGDYRKAIDIDEFEKRVCDEMGLIPEIGPRYRTTYFNHIFSSGYAAGYYGYLWAEVIDKDAFSLFEACDNVFDHELATRFKETFLYRGGSEEPMTLFREFAGREPDNAAFLRGRGLVE